MNQMYLANWLILSTFLTLFALDVGIAILLLTPLKRQKAAWIRYITPIWELEGTFAVFYLVNLEATYPSLLPLLAGAYVLPAILAGLFLLLGNAFLAYSEYLKKGMDRYLKIYSISTIIVAFLLAGIFGSAFSGAGINVAAGSSSVLSVLFNPFGILLFFVIALLGIGLVGILFRIKGMKYWGPIILAIATAAILLSTSTTYAAFGIVETTALVGVPAILLIIIYALRLKENRWAGPLAVVWLFLSLNIMGILQYPRAFGGQTTLLAYLNNTAMGGAINLITLICGSLLSAALAYFIYVSYIRK